MNAPEDQMLLIKWCSFLKELSMLPIPLEKGQLVMLSAEISYTIQQGQFGIKTVHLVARHCPEPILPLRAQNIPLWGCTGQVRCGGLHLWQLWCSQLCDVPYKMFQITATCWLEIVDFEPFQICFGSHLGMRALLSLLFYISKWWHIWGNQQQFTFVWY